MDRVGHEIEQHLPDPSRVERSLAATLVAARQPLAVVLDQCARIGDEAMQELRRILRQQIQAHHVGIGAGEEQQIIDDLIQPVDFLKLHQHRIFMFGYQTMVGQHFFRVQAHQ